MGRMPTDLRETIAGKIRRCRMVHFPGRGDGRRCAEAFGVSPQQWSLWERGIRTPDELRMVQLARFFGVTVEYLRRLDGCQIPQRSDLIVENSAAYSVWTAFFESEIRLAHESIAKPVMRTNDFVHHAAAPTAIPPLPENISNLTNLHTPPIVSCEIRAVATSCFSPRRASSSLTFDQGLTIPPKTINAITRLDKLIQEHAGDLLHNGYCLRLEVLVAIPSDDP